MKTERLTLLTSPEFKAYVSAEALREGVSVAELIRSRCERRPSDEETILAAMTAELNKSLAEARAAVQSGLDEVHSVLAQIRARRATAAVAAPPAARARKAAGARA